MSLHFWSLNIFIGNVDLMHSNQWKYNLSYLPLASINPQRSACLTEGKMHSTTLISQWRRANHILMPTCGKYKVCLWPKCWDLSYQGLTGIVSEDVAMDPRTFWFNICHCKVLLFQGEKQDRLTSHAGFLWGAAHGVWSIFGHAFLCSPQKLSKGVRK